MKYSWLLLVLAGTLFAQTKKIKTGLTWEDYAYTMPAGVTAREVTYYSDGVACYGKIFFPKGFAASDNRPGIVLGQGWAGTHYSIEKYAARFAARGMAAMVIDYRGWGLSDGFAELARPKSLEFPDCRNCRDDQRFTRETMSVTIKRTRLIPLKMVEDYRNAISYLQGEPGIDRERIGVWGSSFAGGHSLVTAALDARVKAVVIQIPGIGGKLVQPGPYQPDAKLLEDAIRRARTGQGEEYETGYSVRRMVDVETQQAVAEYRPMHYVPRIGPRPVLIMVAENEELMKNEHHGKAAFDTLPGPKDFIVLRGITHFEAYTGEAFETGSKAAADWFEKYLAK
ncbi:MAG: hypothetical protein FJW39_20870 [Acidobacteria bacterium]|nr:hypothetical protein [Acidobacteriota bacterium]